MKHISIRICWFDSRCQLAICLSLDWLIIKRKHQHFFCSGQCGRENTINELGSRATAFEMYYHKNEITFIQFTRAFYSMCIGSTYKLSTPKFGLIIKIYSSKPSYISIIQCKTLRLIISVPLYAIYFTYQTHL